LPNEFNESNLVALFDKFGTIFACMVVMDKEKKTSRDIGFIDFETEEEAKKAKESMNGFKIEEKQLSVKSYHSSRDISTH